MKHYRCATTMRQPPMVVTNRVIKIILPRKASEGDKSFSMICDSGI
jgi:hypothetical protein